MASRHERKAQIAAHASFYFITVILDTLRRKGLISDDEIARAIDVYPHDDAAMQADTRAFLHRCMALIENVPVSPSVTPSEDGHTDDAQPEQADIDHLPTVEAVTRNLREAVPQRDEPEDGLSTSLAAEDEPVVFAEEREKDEAKRRG